MVILKVKLSIVKY